MNPRLSRWLIALLLTTIIVLAAGRLALEGYASYQVRAADIALEHQNYRVGRDHLENALKVRREITPLHLRAARVCRQAGDFSAAKDHLDRYRSLHGALNDDYKVERLMFSAQTGRLDEVTEQLSRYIDEDLPEKPLVLECLCQVLLMMEFPQPSLTLAEKWLKCQPDNVQALFCKGAGLARLGVADQALEPLRKALGRDPSRDDIRLVYASVLAELLRFDDSRQECEQVLARDPKNTRARLTLFRCLYEGGEFEKAREVIDALLESEPNDGQALYQRGQLAHALGHPDEAEEWLRKALAVEPYNVPVAYLLASCLSEQGKKKEAAEQTDRNKVLEADNLRIQHILGDEMVKRAPTAANCQELGALFLRTGREDTAVRWLYKGLHMDQSHATSHQLLAEYWERAGEPERAEAHRKALHDLRQSAPTPPVEAPPKPPS